MASSFGIFFFEHFALGFFKILHDAASGTIVHGVFVNVSDTIVMLESFTLGWCCV